MSSAFLVPTTATTCAIPLRRGREWELRVLDAMSNRPLPAEVDVFDASERMGEMRWAGSVRCAPDGTARVQVREEDWSRVIVQCSAAGYARVQIDLSGPPEGKGTPGDPLEVRLLQAKCVMLRVIDEQGAPVSAAVVSADGDAVCDSDENGLCRGFVSPFGRKRVEVAIDHPDFARATAIVPLHALDSTSPEPAVVTLSAGWSLEGVVREAGGGAPPQGTKVLLCGIIQPKNSTISNEYRDTAAVDDAGAFEFPHLSADLERDTNTVYVVAVDPDGRMGWQLHLERTTRRNRYRATIEFPRRGEGRRVTLQLIRTDGARVSDGVLVLTWVPWGEDSPDSDVLATYPQWARVNRREIRLPANEDKAIVSISDGAGSWIVSSSAAQCGWATAVLRPSAMSPDRTHTLRLDPLLYVIGRVMWSAPAPTEASVCSLETSDTPRAVSRALCSAGGRFSFSLPETWRGRLCGLRVVAQDGGRQREAALGAVIPPAEGVVVVESPR